MEPVNLSKEWDIWLIDDVKTTGADSGCLRSLAKRAGHEPVNRRGDFRG